MRQLVGIRDNYTEQISYWVTLDDRATLPGLGRKWRNCVLACVVKLQMACS